METMEAGAELYERGAQTLVAAWAEHARGATNAAVLNFSGVAVAVFPDGREREFYNNAVLDRGLAAGASGDAVDIVECVYAAAGMTRFAVWVHESDVVAGRQLERRGYTVDADGRERLCRSRFSGFGPIPGVRARVSPRRHLTRRGERARSATSCRVW